LPDLFAHLKRQPHSSIRPVLAYSSVLLKIDLWESPRASGTRMAHDDGKQPLRAIDQTSYIGNSIAESQHRALDSLSKSTIVLCIPRIILPPMFPKQNPSYQIWIPIAIRMPGTYPHRDMFWFVLWKPRSCHFCPNVSSYPRPFA